jgi:tripartite ATP-independent transporter DctP family solute receptor
MKLGRKEVSFLMVMLFLFPMVWFHPGTANSAEKIIMKVAHSDAMDVSISRKHAQLVAFQHIVNAESGGRIEVQVFGAGSVGGEREIAESVMAGNLQGTSVSGALGGFYPPAMVSELPYLFPNAAVAWDVLDGPMGKKLSEGIIKKTGMRNLGFAEVGIRHFTNSKREIRTPEDMKGLKIRVQETPLYITLVKSLGANPTPVPWPETYSALQSGVVDGQENPVSSILFAKLYEVQKFLTLDGHVYGVDWFLVNEKFFQSLSPDLQFIVLEAAKVSCGVGRGTQQLISAQGLEKLAQAGVKIYSPTEKEKELFKKACQKPVADWLKTKVEPSLVDEMVKASEDVAKAHMSELK